MVELEVIVNLLTKRSRGRSYSEVEEEEKTWGGG
jgi:hypothetical protein